MHSTQQYQEIIIVDVVTGFFFIVVHLLVGVDFIFPFVVFAFHVAIYVVRSLVVSAAFPLLFLQYNRSFCTQYQMSMATDWSVVSVLYLPVLCSD